MGVELRSLARRIWRTLAAPRANAVVAFLCAALFGYDAWRQARLPESHAAAGLALFNVVLWAAIGIRCVLEARDGSLHEPDNGRAIQLHLHGH